MAANRTKQLQKDAEEKAGDWQMLHSDAGKPYWYNRETLQTSWDRPQVLRSSRWWCLRAFKVC